MTLLTLESLTVRYAGVAAPAEISVNKSESAVEIPTVFNTSSSFALNCAVSVLINCP